MNKMRAFLDTNVLVAYLRGDESVHNLFSRDVLQKVRYVVNPVVYQELILAESRPDATLDELSELVDIVEIHPGQTAEQLAEYRRNVRALRNQAVHANDVLILGTAKQCDYLLTYDVKLIQLARNQSVKAMPPEEFLHIVEVDQ